MNDGASVRHYLTEALRLDLIGPRPEDDTLQRERLPQAPSLWYMTGFLAPTGAPDAQRAQDIGEELDEPAESIQGGDDSSTPERGSGKRVFLPSSMGLSILVDTKMRHLAVTVSWGDYTPDRENADDETGVSEQELEDDATASSGRNRYKPWDRHPRSENVPVDLSTVAIGDPTPVDVPNSGGLKLVCLVRKTQIKTVDGLRDARAVSLFVINRRSPTEDDDLQDTAFAFQVEMSVEAGSVWAVIARSPIVGRQVAGGAQAASGAAMGQRSVMRSRVARSGANSRVRQETISAMQPMRLSASVSPSAGPSISMRIAPIRRRRASFHPLVTVEHVKGWLRLWVAIPNAVAGMKPLERDLLIVIDEMPRIGYLKPVMDGYTMAAGKGVHFWCFAQSISALDTSWGKEHRKTLIHLAELVQVLGFPRTDAEGAEELSKAIGTATFEGRTESRSGTVAESRIVTANTQWQAGESTSLVRERLVTPDELMTLGPDRQYVIASPKDMPRDALHLHHARYWVRRDARFLADPNPFVLRKERAAGQSDTGGRLRWPWLLVKGDAK